MVDLKFTHFLLQVCLMLLYSVCVCHVNPLIRENMDGVVVPYERLRFDRTVLTKGGLKLRAVVYFDENGKPTTTLHIKDLRFDQNVLTNGG